MPALQPLRNLQLAIRDLGLKPVLRYGWYQLVLQTGWLRLQTPAHAWADRPLRSWLLDPALAEADRYQEYRREVPFLFKATGSFDRELKQTLKGEEARVRAAGDQILSGNFLHFGTQGIALGFPPEWNENVGSAGLLDRSSRPGEKHWTAWESREEIDPKLIWENSRFGWVYPLVRAYRFTGEARYWEGFWSLLTSWCGSCPPNRGPQWVSGQEIAIRLLALITASFGFEPEWEGKPERLSQLAAVIAFHADRIPPTLSYAQAQQNNHLLSEACGLLSAGLLFPEFEKAGYWASRGRETLLTAIGEQFYPDGGYIQHSTNYHRMALQICIWAASLAELYRQPFPQGVIQTLEGSSRCYAAQIDRDTGQALNWGHNDGSNILPFSVCEYGDHRPTLQAAVRVFSGKSCLSAGLWDEYPLWLGRQAIFNERTASVRGWENGRRPLSNQDIGEPAASFPDAGLYFLQGQASMGVLRAAKFRHRPAHADQLHFSLSWRGEAVLQDPGSYRYTAESPWNNGLSGPSAHNAPHFPGMEPMLRAGRFLWLDWSEAFVPNRWKSASGDLEFIQGTHNGYRKFGILHERTVVRAGHDLWLVVDEIRGKGNQPIRFAWRLADFPWDLNTEGLHLDSTHGSITLFSDLSCENPLLLRGEQVLTGSPSFPLLGTEGWVSPTYNRLKPCLCLVMDLEVALPFRGSTWICMKGEKPADLEIHWKDPGSSDLPFSSLSWRGEMWTGLEPQRVR